MDTRGRSRTASGDRTQEPEADMAKFMKQLQESLAQLQEQNTQIQSQIVEQKQEIQADIQAQKLEAKHISEEIQAQITTVSTQLQIQQEHIQNSLATLTVNYTAIQEDLLTTKMEFKQENAALQQKITTVEESSCLRYQKIHEDIQNLDQRLEQEKMLNIENKQDSEARMKNIENFHRNLDSQVHKNREQLDTLEATIALNKEKNICDLENMKIEEKILFEEMEKEINILRKQGFRNISVSSTNSPIIHHSEWPKFGGVNDNIHSMCYLQNILRLTSDIEDPKQGLTLIALTLRNRALEWWNRICDQVSTLEEFAIQFERQFWSQSLIDRQKIQLLTARYKPALGTRESYATSMYNCCKYIPDMSEKEIATYLLKHFIVTESDSILSRDVNNIEELIELLRKLDDLSDLRVQQRVQLNQGEYKPNYYNQRNSHPNRSYQNRNEGYQRQEVNHNGNSNNQNYRDQNYNRSHTYYNRPPQNNSRPNQYDNGREFPRNPRPQVNNIHYGYSRFSPKQRSFSRSPSRSSSKSRSPPREAFPEEKKTPIILECQPSSSKM